MYGERGRIGLITLASDSSVLPEYLRLMPDGAMVYPAPILLPRGEVVGQRRAVVLGHAADHPEGVAHRHPGRGGRVGEAEAFGKAGGVEPVQGLHVALGFVEPGQRGQILGRRVEAGGRIHHSTLPLGWAMKTMAVVRAAVSASPARSTI